MPLIFFATLIFIFQSGLTEVNAQIWKTNCPLPIYDGIASNLTINGVVLEYDVTYGNGTENNGTFFECGNVGELLNANTIIKEYGATLFDFIPYGWLGFVGDTISATFAKIQNAVGIIWLFINAPAEVTDLEFFTYIQIMLLAFIGFGTFLAIRSGA